MSRSDEGRILGVFLVGGLLGAGLALLLAPQSGKKTRKDISRFTEKVKDEARGVAEDTVESVEDSVHTIVERISDLISTGKELGEDTKKKLLKVITNGQKVIEKQKERLSELVK